MSDNYELEQELGEWEEYFDSDGFLEEPWMQMMSKEMKRKKTLIIVPRRIKQFARAVELVKEIVSIEKIEADIAYNLDMASVFPCDARIEMTADTVESGKESKKQVQELLDIADDFVCMARKNGRINVTIASGSRESWQNLNKGGEIIQKGVPGLRLTRTTTKGPDTWCRKGGNLNLVFIFLGCCEF